MAVTPNEIDVAGQVTVDLAGRLVVITPWADDTFEGRTIGPGRWYHLWANGASIGLVDVARGEVYAYRPYEAGRALGRVYSDFTSALSHFRTDD